MREEILHIMPLRLRPVFERGLRECEGAEEIRIRAGGEPELRRGDASVWLSAKVTAEDIEEMLTFISRYSIYAYEEEIRQGFLTIEGGHRIGFAGQARVSGGQVSHMTNIRFVNIRIASERKGCADKLLPWLFEGGEFLNTLIISRPGAGKTTVLRDCVRLLSNGDSTRSGKKVCVIDERSEIAACHLGIPQNDVGKRADVLDQMPKREGMRMALRGMSPEIIAVDELGGPKDAQAVEEMILCGCKILGTMHGDTIEHVILQAGIGQMSKRKLFQRYVFLKREENGERAFLAYDQNLKRLC